MDLGAALPVLIASQGSIMMSLFMAYLAGNTSGLSNELSDPLDAGGNVACRSLLLNCAKLIQELRDNLCQISYCS